MSGTRPDDPNDIVPHEHRRELRALRVFAAWTNHVDSKSINSLDTLVTENGRAVVRHHLIDFGSTLGSASVKPRDYDEGHQYIVDGGPTAKGIVAFGFYIPSFHFIDYPDFPSVGHFSAERFDPPKWKPRVPNPAFRRARPDDTFWAARRVMAFTDEMIRAAVRTGRYSDPAAEKHIADTLIARRDAIGRAWLTDVNPVIDPVARRLRNAHASGTRRLSPAWRRLRPRTKWPGLRLTTGPVRRRPLVSRWPPHASRRTRRQVCRPAPAHSCAWISRPSIRRIHRGRLPCTRTSSAPVRAGSWLGSSGCPTERAPEHEGRMRISGTGSPSPSFSFACRSGGGSRRGSLQCRPAGHRRTCRRDHYDARGRRPHARRASGAPGPGREHRHRQDA